jgi:hypothetical protein
MKRDGVKVERGTLRALQRATDGAVLVEHVGVVSIIIVITTAILLALTLHQIPGYENQRAALNQPYP